EFGLASAAPFRANRLPASRNHTGEGAPALEWIQETRMPSTTQTAPTLETLKDLARLVQNAEGFRPLVAALGQGRGAVVDGAWGSSAPLVAAALGQHVPRTLLIVIAHPRDLDAWADDLHSFAGSRPVIFPAWDHLPDEDSVADEVAGQRLRLLKALEGDSP